MDNNIKSLVKIKIIKTCDVCGNSRTKEKEVSDEEFTELCIECDSEVYLMDAIMVDGYFVYIFNKTNHICNDCAYKDFDHRR